MAPPPLPLVRPWLDWPWQLRWGILLAYAGIVTWLSLAPAATFARFPLFISHQDKVIHFLLYGFLVLLARWATTSHWTVRPAFLVVVVGAIAYGSLMEFVQGRLVNYHRSLEFGDILANSLGALCFWWLSRLMFVSPPRSFPPTQTE